MPARGHAQIKEFDFYGSFRTWVRELPAPVRRQEDEAVRLYREQLTKNGVAPAEIERRATLVRTHRNEQWDLILYGWVAPARSAAKANEGLNLPGLSRLNQRSRLSI